MQKLKRQSKAAKPPGAGARRRSARATRVLDKNYHPGCTCGACVKYGEDLAKGILQPTYDDIPHLDDLYGLDGGKPPNLFKSWKSLEPPPPSLKFAASLYQPPPVATAGEDYVKIKSVSVDVDPKLLSFDIMRELIDQFLQKNPKDGKKLWDCMATVRGPDQGIGAPASPCDGSDSVAEHKRVARKKLTCTIIRGRLFPGTTNCSSADINNDPSAVVQLPKKATWDHYDKHVFKTCQHLGIPYQVDGEDTVQNQPPSKTAAGGTGSTKYVLKPGGLQFHASFPAVVINSECPPVGSFLRFSSQGFETDQYIVKTQAEDGSPLSNYVLQVTGVPASQFKQRVWKIITFKETKIGAIIIAEVVPFFTVKSTSAPSAQMPTNKWGFSSQQLKDGQVKLIPVDAAKYKYIRDLMASSEGMHDNSKMQAVIQKTGHVEFYYVPDAVVPPVSVPQDDPEPILEEDDDTEDN